MNGGGSRLLTPQLQDHYQWSDRSIRSSRPMAFADTSDPGGSPGLWCKALVARLIGDKPEVPVDRPAVIPARRRGSRDHRAQGLPPARA